MGLHDAFAARLADVLATLESTAVLGAAERRVRGLGGLLTFACETVPCDEAFVALELEHLGRLHVPGIASAREWRTTSVELPPVGTPFAYLLAGGGGHAVELVPNEPLLALLGGALGSAPKQGAFAPIRLGADVVGGLALLFSEPRSGDRALVLAERLADVAAGAVEAFRTERALLEVFAAALPELHAEEPDTRFAERLERFVHRLRLTPEYRRKLGLASAVSRLAERGDAESALARGLLGELERYVDRLEAGEDVDGAASGERR